MIFPHFEQTVLPQYIYIKQKVLKIKSYLRFYSFQQEPNKVQQRQQVWWFCFPNSRVIFSVSAKCLTGCTQITKAQELQHSLGYKQIHFVLKSLGHLKFY